MLRWFIKSFSISLQREQIIAAKRASGFNRLHIGAEDRMVGRLLIGPRKYHQVINTLAPPRSRSKLDTKDSHSTTKRHPPAS
jgi:hypothetical protein